MRTMQDVQLHIRWAIRADMPSVFAIDRELFPKSRFFTPEGNRIAAPNNQIMFVAAKGNEVVGYMVYRFYRRRISLLCIAVDPLHQGTGVGKAMLEKVKAKLNPAHRDRIHVEVPLEQLGVMRFFSSQGFESMFAVNGPGGEPASHVLMRYSYQPPQPEPLSPQSLWRRFICFLFKCEDE